MAFPLVAITTASLDSIELFQLVAVSTVELRLVASQLSTQINKSVAGSDACSSSVRQPDEVPISTIDQIDADGFSTLDQTKLMQLALQLLVSNKQI